MILLKEGLAHHNFGNDVQHLIVTAATARRTMGDCLHRLEQRQNVFHFAVIFQRVLDILIAYLFTIANDDIFHNLLLDLKSFYYYNKSFPLFQAFSRK